MATGSESRPRVIHNLPRHRAPGLPVGRLTVRCAGLARLTATAGQGHGPAHSPACDHPHPRGGVLDRYFDLVHVPVYPLVDELGDGAEPAIGRADAEAKGEQTAAAAQVSGETT